MRKLVLLCSLLFAAPAWADPITFSFSGTTFPEASYSGSFTIDTNPEPNANELYRFTGEPYGVKLAVSIGGVETVYSDHDIFFLIGNNERFTIYSVLSADSEPLLDGFHFQFAFVNDDWLSPIVTGPDNRIPLSAPNSPSVLPFLKAVSFNIGGVIFDDHQVDTLELAQVPEPATWLLILMGIVVLSRESKHRSSKHSPERA